MEFFENFLKKDINLDNIAKSLNSLVQSLSQKLLFKDWINQTREIIEIPEKEIIFFIQKNLLLSLKFKNKQFNYKLKRNFSIIYFFIFNLFIIKCISLKKRKSSKENFDLLIDNISSNYELSCYDDLLNFIPPERIIVRSTIKELKNSNYRIVFKKNFNLTFQECFLLMKLSFSTLLKSYQLNINLFFLLLRIVKEYFLYKRFFEKLKVKNIIMHQHYYSSNIKNYLFRMNNGKNSCLIQKNINTENSNGYYYDADIIFGFSETTKILNKKTFSQLGKNISVGSFFLKKNLDDIITDNNYKFDILYLGGNDLGPGGYYDTYPEYGKDYLMQLEWLINFSEKYPNFSIGFKHHSNNNDNFEKNFFSNSKIIFLDQNLNSYRFAYNSNFIVSWASTMIIEMTQFNKCCYFLNPGFRNNQFLSNIHDFKSISLESFENFEKSFFIAKKNKFTKKYKFTYCENSKNLFEKIVKHLNI